MNVLARTCAHAAHGSLLVTFADLERMLLPACVHSAVSGADLLHMGHVSTCCTCVMCVHVSPVTRRGSSTMCLLAWRVAARVAIHDRQTHARSLPYAPPAPPPPRSHSLACSLSPSAPFPRLCCGHDVCFPLHTVTGEHGQQLPRQSHPDLGRERETGRDARGSGTPTRRIDRGLRGAGVEVRKRVVLQLAVNLSL